MVTPVKSPARHVVRILSEGAGRLPALDTVSTDVALRLKGGGLSELFVDRVRDERDRRTPEQIRVRASLDDLAGG